MVEFFIFGEIGVFSNNYGVSRKGTRDSARGWHLHRAKLGYPVWRKAVLLCCMALALFAGMPPSLAQQQQPPQLEVNANNIRQMGTMFGGTTAAVDAATQALGVLTQLQSISSLQGMLNLIQGPSVQNALKGLGVQDQASAIDGIIQGAMNPAKAMDILNAGGAQAIGQALAGIAPQVANMINAAGMGDLKGAVENLLTQIATKLMGQVGGVLGGMIQSLLGGGGKPPESFPGAGGVGGNPGICYLPCNCEKCGIEIPKHHEDIRNTITYEFKQLRNWIVNTFFTEHVLPAMMLMANQLSTAGIHQVQMFGSILDAKHQLETQRIFQQRTAEAHKDYQPSEGMCTFGTTVRSLAGSERRSNLSQVAFANRMNQRQVLSGDVVSVEGPDSDIRSRLALFRSTYCDKADNAKGLEKLCEGASGAPERRNIDVDFTRNIESRLTLDVDFMNSGTAKTDDEQDLFALSANLFAHNIPPRIGPDLLAIQDKRIRQNAAERYMDLRAIFAKRSVAQNSFAAITSQRVAGAPESAPYTKALIKELGVNDPTEIEKLLGKNPSYFAQMEIMTKKIYQSPLFYTELYDKPANIARKGAAMQAIGLMQDRDLYNSLLRTEAVLSVLLETMLQKEQEKVTSAISGLTPAGGTR